MSEPQAGTVTLLLSMGLVCRWPTADITTRTFPPPFTLFVSIVARCSVFSDVCRAPMLGYLFFIMRQEPPFRASIVNCFPWRFRKGSEEIGVIILVCLGSGGLVAPRSAVVDIALQPIVAKVIKRASQQRVSAHPGGQEYHQSPAW